MGASFVEQVLDRGELIEVERRSDRSRVAVPAGMPDGPTLGVPVIVEGEARATLTFVRATGEPGFSQADCLFAEALAAQAALAYEFERAREDREQLIVIGDRERIARDLHDLVIQRLFAAGMSLQITAPLVNQPVALERISDTIDSIDETIREIRNTIFSLSPPTTTRQQLRFQIIEIVQGAQKILGFEPTVRFDGIVDAAVPDRIIPHVLAVLREGLSNAARHAHASAVSVRVSVGGRGLHLEIIDNGVGITKLRRSNGLSNLEQRAHLLGGSFEVARHDEGGTRLTWSVPTVGGDRAQLE